MLEKNNNNKSNIASGKKTGRLERLLSTGSAENVVLASAF